MKRLLERRNMQVTAFGRPDAAIAALRDSPGAFDLVISDYNMPEKSGLDVAREIRAIRADLPVAIVSGNIDPALRAQAEAAGVRELILKAESVVDFCGTVERLARNPLLCPGGAQPCLRAARLIATSWIRIWIGGCVRLRG